VVFVVGLVMEFVRRFKRQLFRWRWGFRWRRFLR